MPCVEVKTCKETWMNHNKVDSTFGSLFSAEQYVYNVYKQFMSLTPVHDKKPLNTGLRIHIPLHAKSGSNALDAMKRYAQN